jgi:hypothetical protein|eukprot:7391439-Prymnesium_polylepis.2
MLDLAVVPRGAERGHLSRTSAESRSDSDAVTCESIGGTLGSRGINQRSWYVCTKESVDPLGAPIYRARIEHLNWANLRSDTTLPIDGHEAHDLHEQHRESARVCTKHTNAPTYHHSVPSWQGPSNVTQDGPPDCQGPERYAWASSP